MKKMIIPALISMLFLLDSCRVVGDIFKAGFYAGITVVVVIIAVIIYFISKFRGGSNR
ncbi:hypothetical protein HH214_11810 [Mucilaginibacter robiniae]|uniref:Phosphatidate cytidylyltransferase n=1 Tax=Mucilaginibacter robiniae TaxID=2728022 RepID=A0A7L5E0G1_9SPHI|nr:hypothetical protein [Mucilaginibacter robiniae]QJD96511.1 hypothetical protein HH214_11810 [Mucilaginibacter robiniae]